MNIFKKLFEKADESAPMRQLKVWYKDKDEAKKVVADDPSGLRPRLLMLLSMMELTAGLTPADSSAISDAVEAGRYKIVPSINKGDEGFDLIFYF